MERSPRAGPMVLAAVVGLGAGLAAVGFSTLVELSDHFFFDILKDDWLGGLPNARLILIPAIGGLPSDRSRTSWRRERAATRSPR